MAIRRAAAPEGSTVSTMGRHSEGFSSAICWRSSTRARAQSGAKAPDSTTCAQDSSARAFDEDARSRPALAAPPAIIRVRSTALTAERPFELPSYGSYAVSAFMARALGRK
jgi:hypothetical protein